MGGANTSRRRTRGGPPPTDQRITLTERWQVITRPAQTVCLFDDRQRPRDCGRPRTDLGRPSRQSLTLPADRPWRWVNYTTRLTRSLTRLTRLTRSVTRLTRSVTRLTRLTRSLTRLTRVRPNNSRARCEATAVSAASLSTSVRSRRVRVSIQGQQDPRRAGGGGGGGGGGSGGDGGCHPISVPTFHGAPRPTSEAGRLDDDTATERHWRRCGDRCRRTPDLNRSCRGRPSKQMPLDVALTRNGWRGRRVAVRRRSGNVRRLGRLGRLSQP